MTPEPGNLELVQQAVLCLINRERAEHDEAPLQLNSQLDAAAVSHSQEMVSSNYFAHVSPSGLSPVERMQEAGYLPNGEVGYVLGENIGWGTYGMATPEAMVSAWIASPGHLANILEAQYRDTGIAASPEVPATLGGGGPGATYTQEFGVIVR